MPYGKLLSLWKAQSIKSKPCSLWFLFSSYLFLGLSFFLRACIIFLPRTKEFSWFPGPQTQHRTQFSKHFPWTRCLGFTWALTSNAGAKAQTWWSTGGRAHRLRLHSLAGDSDTEQSWDPMYLPVLCLAQHQHCYPLHRRWLRPELSLHSPLRSLPGLFFTLRSHLVQVQDIMTLFSPSKYKLWATEPPWPPLGNILVLPIRCKVLQYFGRQYSKTHLKFKDTFISFTSAIVFLSLENPGN
jgi:hypothetical protein